jgi:peptidoglycan/xylan/chitin deacetylase (PgdA/CDA1 family)
MQWEAKKKITVQKVSDKVHKNEGKKGASTLHFDNHILVKALPCLVQAHLRRVHRISRIRKLRRVSALSLIGHRIRLCNAFLIL